MPAEILLVFGECDYFALYLMQSAVSSGCFYIHIFSKPNKSRHCSGDYVLPTASPGKRSSLLNSAFPGDNERQESKRML